MMARTGPSSDGWAIQAVLAVQSTSPGAVSKRRNRPASRPSSAKS